MKIGDLAQKLRQKYAPGRECGVAKIDHPDWQNIYFVVPPPPPRKVGNLNYPLLGEALKALGGWPPHREMNALDRMIDNLFVKSEAVHSSRLEGTWSTVDHALTPGGIVDEGRGEHQAVRAYANVLGEFLREAADRESRMFTEERIRLMHKRIVERDPLAHGVAGKLRTPNHPGSIVTIGGGIRVEDSVYNPAPAREVKRCLGEVLDWFGDDEMAQRGDAGAGGMSLPVRLAVGHAHFEAVHPFTDGNGRTGRMLWPLQMACAGYGPLYLSGYVEAHREKYVRVLEKAQKKLDYGPVVEFLCEAIIQSGVEAKKTRRAIGTLEEKWRSRGKFRDKSAAGRALPVLLTSPVVTGVFLEETLKVSKAAGNAAVKSLLDRKIIRYRRVEKRRRVYAAEEVVQVLARPFGSEVDLALEKARRLLKLE